MISAASLRRKPCVNHRVVTTVLLCASMLVSGMFGLRSGMTVRIDGHGHLILEAPKLAHAICSEHGSDHHPGDSGSDEGCHDLHHLISVAGADAGSARPDRAASADAADAH